jgi:hypothetical protein
MVRVITGDQADTPITHILTGIAGSGGTATGAIGSAWEWRSNGVSDDCKVIFDSRRPPLKISCDDPF